MILGLGFRAAGMFSSFKVYKHKKDMFFNVLSRMLLRGPKGGMIRRFVVVSEWALARIRTHIAEQPCV